MFCIQISNISFLQFTCLMSNTFPFWLVKVVLFLIMYIISYWKDPQATGCPVMLIIAHCNVLWLILKKNQSHSCWMIITRFYTTIVNILLLRNLHSLCSQRGRNESQVKICIKLGIDFTLPKTTEWLVISISLFGFDWLASVFSWQDLHLGRVGVWCLIKQWT